MKKDLIIGRIYKNKETRELFRIFRSGGSGFYSGRGCTKETAVPLNYIATKDVTNPTLDEINFFLEEEMKNGMAKTWNK